MSSDDVAKRARKSLSGMDPAPFTEPAFEALQTAIGTYIRELMAEAERTAQRRSHDGIVVTSDVTHAEQYLTSARQSRLTDHLGTLGGVLLGAGLGNLVSIIAADEVKLAGVLVTLLLSVAGVALVVYQIATDH